MTCQPIDTGMGSAITLCGWKDQVLAPRAREQANALVNFVSAFPQLVLAYVQLCVTRYHVPLVGLV